MENKLIAILLTFFLGIIGITHLIQPSFKPFRASNFTDDLFKEFQQFKWKYGKVYQSESEDQRRFEIYKSTSKFINGFNNQKNGASLKINRFADLTDEEFKSNYLKEDNYINKQTKVQPKKIANRPQSIDHVGTKVWNGVDDEGNCMASYAFSSVYAIEGAYAKLSDQLTQFSVQEVIDCAQSQGCNGGSRENVFTWVHQNHGLCFKSTYPFQYMGSVQQCLNTVCTNEFTSGREQIYLPPKDIDTLLNYLAIVPVTVAVDATQYLFRYYNTGIINTITFSSLNHNVLAVGYNEAEGYIRGKNTWGTGWGEQGYFKVAIATGAGPLGFNLSPILPEYLHEF